MAGNDVREPTWIDLQKQLVHMEAKISLHLAGVDDVERRKLKDAMDTLGAFVLTSATKENRAAPNRRIPGALRRMRIQLEDATGYSCAEPQSNERNRSHPTVNLKGLRPPQTPAV